MGRTYEKRLREAYEKGREAGVLDGIAENMLFSISSLMKNMHVSAEQAAEMLGYKLPEDGFDFFEEDGDLFQGPFS